MGFFDKLKQGLKKTAQLLNTDVRDLFKSEGRLVDDAFLDELLAILIKTDMGVQAAQADRRRDRARKFRARVVHMDEVLASDQDEAQGADGAAGGADSFAASGPTVIMVAGVNGAGKTTSIAKLAPHVQVARQEGRAGRGRHVSGRGRRAAYDLGRPAGGGDRQGRAGERPGQRRPSRRGRGHRDRTPTSASSTRPAGCRRSRT